MENAVETLESQKEELSSSMDSSDYGTMVQREMMKIRKEGMMKENCVTDTHKIIYEAEKRVGKKKIKRPSSTRRFGRSTKKRS